MLLMRILMSFNFTIIVINPNLINIKMRVYLIFIISLFIVSLSLNAQENTVKMDYSKSTIIINEGVKTYEYEDNGISESDKQEVLNYYDGFGRTIQSVYNKGAVSGSDVVMPRAYNSLGKEERTFLPYTKSAGGTYDPNAIKNATNGEYSGSNQYNYYQSASDVTNDTHPYAEIIMENATFAQVKEVGSFGSEWQPQADDSGHTVKMQYRQNGVSEVKLYKVIDGVLTEDGYFNENLLTKTIIKDENWSPSQSAPNDVLHTTEKFSNDAGQTFLIRTYVEDGDDEDELPDVLDTYYVYDSFNSLRFILPPQAVNQINEGNPLNWIKINTNTTLNSELTGDRAYMVKPGARLTLSTNFHFTATTDESLSVITTAVDENLIYSFNYDDKRRLIEKVVPGAEVVYYVYDHLDRIVAIQDGEQRKNNKWFFYKYDAYNRDIIRGEFTNSGNRSQLQFAIDQFYQDGTKSGYEYLVAGNDLMSYTTNNAYPTGVSETDYQLVYFYDNYNWLQTDVVSYRDDLANQFNSHNFSGVSVPDVTCLEKTFGHVTGKRVKVFDNEGYWLQTSYFYNRRYQPTIVVADNYVGGEDIILNNYSFLGNLSEYWICHTSVLGSSSKKIIRGVNNYDQGQRLVSEQYQMTDEPSLLTLRTIEYNDLGQVKKQYLGGSTESNSAQVEDFLYNIRGWLTQINNPDNAITTKRKFALKLNYNEVAAGVTNTAQYNGNLSSVEWLTPESSSINSPSHKQIYGYTYDALNQLQKADYGEGSDGLTNADAFNESVSAYDLNGNILGITRRNGSNGEVDNLDYKYIGNQLLSITDKGSGSNSLGFYDGNSGADYYYDDNGNLKADRNKGIKEITYTSINNVKSVIADGDESIDFIYTAEGNKLAKVNNESTIYYAGLFIYEDNTLKTILNSVGQYEFTGSSGEYQYQLKDHLGNVRLVVNKYGTVKQQSAYYAFGATFMTGGSSDNKYLHGGALLNDDNIGQGKLDWYDLGFRNYDPYAGRFFGLDPLAVQNHMVSPYAYAYNNPVNYIDYLGLTPVPICGTGNGGEGGCPELPTYYIQYYDKETDQIYCCVYVDCEDNIISASDAINQVNSISAEYVASYALGYGLTDRSEAEINFNALLAKGFGVVDNQPKEEFDKDAPIDPIESIGASAGEQLPLGKGVDAKKLKPVSLTPVEEPKASKKGSGYNFNPMVSYMATKYFSDPWSNGQTSASSTTSGNGSSGFGNVPSNFQEGQTTSEQSQNNDGSGGAATSTEEEDNENNEEYSMEVQRIAESSDATVSKFTLRGPRAWETISGYILEPGGPSTTTRGQDKRIPAGTYNVDPYSSASHPNVYRVSNEQVPTNRYILIHSGNLPSHTLGCLLPGRSYSKVNGEYAVWNSGNTLNSIRSLLGGNSATLNIHDIENTLSLPTGFDFINY